MRGPRSPDRARESEVGTAHLLEDGRRGRLAVEFAVGARLDVDDDLQWRVKAIEEPPKSGQPLVPLVLGGPGESNRVGLDDRE